MKKSKSFSCPHPTLLTSLVLAGLATTGCSSSGGGGGGASSSAPASSSSSSSSSSPVAPPEWQANDFTVSYEEFAQRCEIPRTGTNPVTGEAYVDVPGTAMHEKMWLRAWADYIYLWSDRLTDVDPTPLTIDEYFETRKIEGERFNFTEDTTTFELQSEDGISLGYGVRWSGDQTENATVTLRVAYVQEGSAAAAVVSRGDYVLSVDGIDVASSQQNQQVFNLLRQIIEQPSAPGESHEFVIRDHLTSEERTVTLEADYVAFDPVPTSEVINVDGADIGYLLFNAHNAASEAALISSIQALAGQDLDDLVLDLRYNQGGFLEIASQLAYMIADPALTAGKTFEAPFFNNQHPISIPRPWNPSRRFRSMRRARVSATIKPGNRCQTLGSTGCSY